MRADVAAEWLMYFYIYCFLGWIWECCYVSVKEKKLVNRGFMKGPMLPIYGCGAVCVLLVTLPVRDNYILMALVGMAAATVLEFATGAAMEAMFKVRYWDYSTEFLNLRGYVCLKSTLCWGFMTFFVTYGLQPPIADLVSKIPGAILKSVDFLIALAAMADFATSFKAAIDFRDVLLKVEQMKGELADIQQRLNELEQTMKEGFAESSSRKRDELIELGASTVDSLWEFGEKTRDTFVENTVKTKDRILGGTAKARDMFLEETARTKDRILDGTAKMRNAFRGETGEEEKKLRQEWQELRISEGIHLEKIRMAYSRSIRGLLRRNPSTVSRNHAEALEVIKKVIRENRDTVEKRTEKRAEKKGE